MDVEVDECVLYPLENVNITLSINGCQYLRQLPDLPGDRHKL